MLGAVVAGILLGWFAMLTFLLGWHAKISCWVVCDLVMVGDILLVYCDCINYACVV